MPDANDGMRHNYRAHLLHPATLDRVLSRQIACSGDPLNFVHGSDNRQSCSLKQTWAWQRLHRVAQDVPHPFTPAQHFLAGLLGCFHIAMSENQHPTGRHHILETGELKGTWADYLLSVSRCNICLDQIQVLIVDFFIQHLWADEIPAAIKAARSQEPKSNQTQPPPPHTHLSFKS